MQVDVHTEAGATVVEPSGDIDGKTAPDFQAQILALIQPHAQLVLNLARVPFMSSAGLRSMLLVYREAKAKDARVVLTDVNEDIRNSMAATGFLSFFTVRDHVQDALHAVAER